MEINTSISPPSPVLKSTSPEHSVSMMSEHSFLDVNQTASSRGTPTRGESGEAHWLRPESSDGSYNGDMAGPGYTSSKGDPGAGRRTMRRSDSFAVGHLTSFIRSKLIQFLGEGTSAAIDDVLSEDEVIARLNDFYTASAPPKLAFFYQNRDRSRGSNDERSDQDEDEESEEPSLFLADLDTEQLDGRCIYFLRHGMDPVRGNADEFDVSCGEVCGSTFDVIDLFLSELHGPILHSRHYDWKGMGQEGAAVRDCLAVMDQFRDHVVETITGIYGGVQLYPLDEWVADDPRALHSNYNKLALDDKAMVTIEATLEQWCNQLDTLVHENDIDQIEDNVGPRSELAWWRTRSAKLNSVVEQLKGRDARIVLGVVTAGKSRLLKRWRHADGQLTEELNEAKDNVKYLTSLDHFIEPLYSGTAAQILESFHGLFTNLKMLITIARHYSSPKRIVRILFKCASQTVAACKRLLQIKGKLLEQNPADALESAQGCLALCKQFHENVVSMRERLMAQGKSKRFDFNTDTVLFNIKDFERRLTKVQSMIVTINQFSTLNEAAIDGLEATKNRFNTIIEDLKLKPYDVLDCSAGSFDHDFEVFESQIAAVEFSLRDYVERVFEDMQSTDLALDLLGQLEVILQRESLKGDLQEKYSLIFQFYGDELESVQDLYDKQKTNPPLPRNMPSVSGNILWARQLLTRIEEPMQRFQSNKVILAAAESKKVIRLYNRVARTLIEFEELWVQAWCKSIEHSRAGLQATLIVRSPEEPDTLCVNFDPEVTQLIREAKVLRRLGVAVPDMADTILMQEGKFKLYHDTLHNFLREYNITVNRIPPKLRPLMGKHLEELERVVRPGLMNLTWQSMNIDGYLHRIYSVLQRVDTLVKQVQGLVEFNIDRNLKQLQRMILVNLPDDGHFTLDQFVAMQEQDVNEKMETLRKVRSEVEIGLRGVLETLSSFVLESGERLELDPESVEGFREHFEHLFYLAMLQAAKNSLSAIKKRLASRRQGGFLFMDTPFFDVDVELTIPSVSLHPSLVCFHTNASGLTLEWKQDEVQNAINESARLVLSCAKAVPVLSHEMDDPEAPTYYSLIAADVQIVCSILLLTGSVEGSKRQVLEYLETFTRYEFLWVDDKHAAYSKFMKKNPDLEDFERELAKYQAIEAEIASIRQVYNLGCMSLRSQSLKYSLKAEASAWKSQYAKNLHRQAKIDMDQLVEYLESSSAKLRQEVTNVDEVGSMVSMLKELRARESDLEQQILPIESRYYLLTKYDVRLPKEETDMLASLRKMWKDLAMLGQEKSSKLSHLQAGFKRDVVKAVKSFALEVMQFCNDFDMNGPMLAGLAPAEALERLHKYQALFREKEQNLKALQEREALFGLQETHHEDLERVRSELDLLDMLYSLHHRVEQTFFGFSEYLWQAVPTSVEAMADSVAQFQHDLAQLPRTLKEWTAYIDLERAIEDFANILPILSSLCHPGIRKRHWNDIFMASMHGVATTNLPSYGPVGTNFTWENMKLKHVLALNLQGTRPEIEDVCFAAKKEAEIESRVQAIADYWSDQVFAFADHKDRSNALIDPRNLATCIENLDESLATLSTIANSKYSEALVEEVQLWVTKLSSVSEVLESWSNVQSMWIYIEAVFCVPHVAGQLPNEAKRFGKIDGNYTKLMARASEDRHVVDCCCADLQLKNLLPHLTDQLEQCQRSLTGYLETKRAAFPRFYFVSDKVLLEMMSTGHQDPEFEQYLSAIFEGIRFFTYDSKTSSADAISTVNSRHLDAVETLSLCDPVKVHDGIENWLLDVVAEVGRTLRGLVVESRTSGDAYIVSELIFKYPAQVCALALQLQWTKDTEDALARSKTEKNIMVHTNKRNSNILVELCSLLDNAKQSPSTRLATQTLILVQMHQRDIFDFLFRKHATSTSDFDFVRQTRYSSAQGTDDIVVSIADVGIRYTFEYLGLLERVVATALTDRCFIAMSQALGACMGGAVVGPAGTGKTETVKDLGRGCGRIVAIFNCTQQMDFRMMERTYKGLVACGAFGCFDEFNRIEQDVLSACAQQLTSVLSALREGRGTFVYTDGDQVKCDSATGIFVTMNPGYQGRQDLRSVPNLQHLFRTFSMVSADKAAVLTVKLTAYGFQNCAKLASKIAILFDLCQIQLSKQPYYDFSMRNIIAIVRVAGQMIREQPDKPEVLLLLLALRETNLPRLDQMDKDLFLSFMSDLFPDVDMEQLTLVRSFFDVTEQATQMGYDPNPLWVEKASQIHKTCQARHGVMVVGPARCGKSSILDVLYHTEKKLYQAKGIKLVFQKMNPKCQRIEEMYGKMEMGSNQWNDGTFTCMWRKASMQPATHAWILLDGPIDMLWMENLNTVLDENKILTLANGDRIAMTPGTRIMFETAELVHASPAVVSRVGVVYVEASTVPWRSITTRWLTRRAAEEAALLELFFDKYMEPIMTFVSANCFPVATVAATQGPVMLTTLYESITKSMEPAANRLDSAGKVFAEKLFIFCAVWSLGGLLQGDCRLKLNSFLNSISDLIPKPQIERLASTMSKESNRKDLQQDQTTVFDYFPDDVSMEWEHWRTKVAEWTNPADATQITTGSLLVPTFESCRFEWIARTLTSNKTNILVTGPSASTKSSNIRMFVRSLDQYKFTSTTVSFTSASTPKFLMERLGSMVEKKQAKTFAPQGGKTCLFVVEDVSYEEADAYGDKGACELLRQLATDGGYHNPAKAGEWRNIASVQYMPVMTHPKTCHKDVSDRLKGALWLLNIACPRQELLVSIFSCLILSHFDMPAADPAIYKMLGQLVEASIKLNNILRVKLPPTPAKAHYAFNLHDISRIFLGFCQFSPNQVESVTTILSWWYHESSRVLVDKLATQDDQETAQDLLLAQLRVETSQVENLQPDAVLTEEFTGVLFGFDFRSEEGGYGALPALSEVREALEQGAEAHNVKSVLFDTALLHILRISRIFSIPKASLLLVGICGSDRSSLAKLASYLCGVTLMSQASQTPGHASTRTDVLELVRSAHRLAGTKSVDVCLLLSTVACKDRIDILDGLNQFLSTGVWPGLYSQEEMASVADDMRMVMTDGVQSIRSNDRELYEMFETRASQRLHVIIFCPADDSVRDLITSYPALQRSCTINWILPWSPDATTRVARAHLEQFSLSDNTDPDILARFSAGIHMLAQDGAREHLRKTGRQIHVTPRTFTLFINTYRRVFETQTELLMERIRKMTVGLEKLNEARTQIGVMEADLEGKDSVLAVAQEQTASLLKIISAGTMKAEIKKGDVVQAKNVLAEQTQMIQHERESCQNELVAAEPAVKDAEKALQSVSNKDIISLRSYKNPSYVVKLVFDAVLLLMNRPVRPVEVADANTYRDSYAYAQAMISDSSFLKNLASFPKELITDETIELLQPYLDHKDFNPTKTKLGSPVASALCIWVQSMVKYHEIARGIKPRMDELQRAEAHAALSNKQLQMVVADYEECQKELDRMQREFEAAMLEKQRLQLDSDRTRHRVETATSLLTSLEEDMDKWQKCVDDEPDDTLRLPGDCAIATSMMVYLGPFNREARAELFGEITAECIDCGVTYSSDLHLPKFFTTDNEMSSWFAQGLPCDEFSIQSALLTLYSTRYPLLIDPQEQAVQWIKQKDSPVVVHQSQGSNVYSAKVEECLAYGKTLLVENVGDFIDPVLDPVIGQEWWTTARGRRVMFMGREVEWHPNFKLYISTRLLNPNPSPEFCSRAAVIDFSITLPGFEDQLLSAIVRMENPKLQASRLHTLAEVREHRERIETLEQRLLTELSASTGGLLENDPLMSSMAETKSSLKEVDEKLTDAQDREEKVASAYEEFRVVATRASLLYFVAMQMGTVHPMYQISKTSFDTLFARAIAKSAELMSIETKKTSMIAHLTSDSLEFYSMGYMQQHKSLFELLVATRLWMHEQHLEETEYMRVLSRCGATVGSETVKQIPRKSREWIPDSVWNNCVCLAERIPRFGGLIELLGKKEAPWRNWLDRESPELEPAPELELDAFHKLLLVRALREDRVLEASRIFCEQYLGKALTRSETREVSVLQALEASTSSQPIILCIFIPGADITSAVVSLAKKRQVQAYVVSIGRGQEGAMEKAIASARGSSSWVLLQNAHLNVPAVNMLEQRLDGMLTKSTNELGAMRVWITTEQRDTFSSALILMSVRAAFELPEGVKSSMRTIYTDFVSQDLLESADSFKAWGRMLYSMSLCWSMMQQRGKYGAVGWSTPFELNVVDWQMCSHYQRDYLVEKHAKGTKLSNTTLAVLRYMAAEVHFGGRVADSADRKILDLYLDRFLGEEVLLDNTVEVFPNIRVPSGCKELSDFVAFIDELPGRDSSLQFGLGLNADHAHKIETSQKAIDFLVNLHPSDLQSALGNRDRFLLDVVNSTLSRIPGQVQYVDKAKGTHAAPKPLKKTPLSLLLQQEVERLHQVERAAREELQMLQQALSGAVPMGAKLQELSGSMLHHKVPPSWAASSWQAASLPDWLAGLQQRHEQLQRWTTHAKPKSFWISGLFNPAALITCLKQEQLRKLLHTALDDLVLSVEVQAVDAGKANQQQLAQQQQQQEHAADGIVVHGLHLEGAAWSSKDARLVDAPAKALFCDFPKLIIVAHRAGDESKTPRRRIEATRLGSGEVVGFTCPCYTSIRRTSHNFLLNVPMTADSMETVHKWIFRGVALLTTKT